MTNVDPAEFQAENNRRREQDNLVNVIREYMMTIRSVVTISTTAAVFPITLLNATKDGDGGIVLNDEIAVSLFFFLVSVLTGLFFQFEGTRRIADKLGVKTSKFMKFLNKGKNIQVGLYLASVASMFFGLIALFFGLVDESATFTRILGILR